ncbi:MAG: isocitrate lyase [Parachlamydiaceae bacterium]
MKAQELEKKWKEDPRWKGVYRSYSAEEVLRLRGSLKIEYTLADLGAKKLWKLLNSEPFVRALGAMTGCQAVQQVEAGLKSIYLSGWQVAADQNDALETYPDLSLYPLMSMPHLIRRIQKALQRADQIHFMENDNNTDWFVPLVADAEAGFGGSLNAFELIKAMIAEGVAAVHLEDQLSSLKKCGHMGGKVLVPIEEFIQKLVMTRLASDVLDVPTVVIARTDAESATLLRSDADPLDQPFLTGERTTDGFFKVKNGIDFAIQRGRAYAPYADVLWCETGKPDLGEARAFAQGIHEKFPGKILAYNCSPSFNWSKHLNEKEIATFQEKLGELGYKFQFVTLAGFHALNASMFKLASQYKEEGMKAYAEFQQEEMILEKERGYSAIKHQKFVGAGYYDEVMMLATEGNMTTHAMKGSTEEAQF